MGLVYSDFDSIKQNAGNGVSVKSINASLNRLLENDNALNPASQQVMPQIWENRWYNQALDRSLFYKKGDAVWLNTEDIDDFVIAKENDIYNYVINNSQLKSKYLQLSAAYLRSELLEFYKQVVRGINGKQPLYYLGHLSDEVQIRVSLSDDNNATPNDNKYWKDFFVKNSPDDVQLSILQQLSIVLDEQFEKHVNEYHADSKIATKNEISSRYLLNDFSNLSSTQKFQNYKWYVSQTRGVDFVKKTIIKKYNEGFEAIPCCKWYKLWNSGFLEHGGLIDVMNPTNTEDILVDAEANVVKVNLRWRQPDGLLAPVYNYPVEGLDSFYHRDKSVLSYDGHIYNIKTVDICEKYRYIIQLSPKFCTECTISQQVSNSGVSSGINGVVSPYVSTFANNSIVQYSNDVFELKNSSFCFMPSGNASYYSYHICGFTNITK